MTISEIRDGQARIEKEISRIAEANGLNTEDREPITDGVGNIQCYLESHPRVAWILKEPYDDERPDGYVFGGGWSVAELFTKPECWGKMPPTWRRVIYVMHGLTNGLKYSEQDNIRNNPSMKRALESVAWINLSKMPARRYSNRLFKEAYKLYWRSIVLEQIKLYDPEVIVFGNTLSVCREDFIAEDLSPMERVLNENGRCFINVYRHDGRLLLDAYHPAIRYSEAFYVDSLIDTIKKYYHYK